VVRARPLAIALAPLALLACGGPRLPADLAGTLVFVSDRGGRDSIYLRRLPHGADFLLVSQLEPVGSPALSPDGSQVAFTMNGRIGVAKVETQQTRFLTQGVEWRDDSPAWRPDGRALVVSSRTSEGAQADVHLLTLTDEGAARRPLTRTPHDETEAVFAPDGASLVYVREERLFRFDLVSGQTRALTGGFRAMRCPRFLPDGRLLVLWTQEKLFGIDLLGEDGTARETLLQGPAYYRSLSPSPDGRYLAAGLAYRTDALKLRQNEGILLLDVHGKTLGPLAQSWRSATHSPYWGR